MDRPRRSQEPPKAAPRRPKTPQDRPKTPQRPPQDHPRSPQDRPRPPQDRPRSLQDQVFIEKGVEKGIEEASKPGNSQLLGYDWGDEAGRSIYISLQKKIDSAVRRPKTWEKTWENSSLTVPSPERPSGSGLGHFSALIRLPDRFPARVWATFRPDRFQDRPLWPQDRQLRP